MEYNLNSPRILISGGRGFLGSYLLRHFGGSGQPIERSGNTPLPLEVSGNPQVNVIIHCASAYGRNGETERQIFEVNLEYGHKLLDQAIAVGVGVFLNVGSALPDTLNAYTKSKACFSREGLQKCSQTGTTFINCSCQHFYGPGDPHFLGKIARDCREGRDILLTEGTQRRDFIHLEDVFRAFQLLIQRAISDGVSRNVSLGTGDAPTLHHIVTYIHSLLNSKSRLIFGAVPFRPNEPMNSVADSEFLQNIGFKIKYPYQEGIPHWLREEGWL